MKKAGFANIFFATVGYAWLAFGVLYSGVFGTSIWGLVCLVTLFPFILSVLTTRMFRFTLGQCWLMIAPVVVLVGLFSILRGDYRYALETLVPMNLFMWVGFQVGEFWIQKKAVRG
jgi:hypothetical protein